MLKYLSKFTMDILPSVAATIIGAYIVNHYIVTKPGTDAPVAAAVSSETPKKSGAKNDAVANAPEAGVRAKGISEKAVFDKSGFDQPTEKAAADKAAIDKAAADKEAAASAEKPEDKPSETASIPADSHRRATAAREKTAIRTIPLTTTASLPQPAQPAAPAVVPVAAPATAPTVEAAVTPEDRRDANDLARAAIERLRGTGEASPRPLDAARAPDAPRVVSAPQIPAPQVSAPVVRPLPPPIMVSSPSSSERSDPTAGQPMQPPYATSSARSDDPRRPTPPADIPTSAPLDLRAEAMDSPASGHRNVAQDMLAAAKSVFHSVLPQ